MILLAESGSTKTDWRIIDGAIDVVAVQTEGINPYFQDKTEIMRLLIEQLVPNVEVNAVSEIYYYGTGITDDTKRSTVASALNEVFVNCKTSEIESDVLAAARGLFGYQSGIAVILGTGSNSCLYENGKIRFQIPPLGFWLGDEGSGGHLGKMLLLSYLHKEMSPNLRAKFEEEFGALDRLEVLELAYRRPNPNRYFASYARFVLANKQDAQVAQLIQGSFYAFFKIYLLKYPDIKQQSVGFIGSIAYYFQTELKAVADELGVHTAKIMKTPMEGLINYHRTEAAA